MNLAAIVLAGLMFLCVLSLVMTFATLLFTMRQIREFCRIAREIEQLYQSRVVRRRGKCFAVIDGGDSGH
jgi:hypothetical protein